MKQTRLLLSLSLVGLVAACSLPAMRVAPELASGAQRPVEIETFGTGNHVRFGAYHVDAVDRGWYEGGGETSAGGWFPEYIKSVSRETQHQDYRFTLLEDGHTPRTVRCRAEMDDRSVDSSVGKLSSTMQGLHCGLWLAADPAQVARLDVVDGVGQVVLGGRTLAIEARDLHGRADTSEPAGYAVSEGGRDLAVVQVVNSGGAWIARDLDADTRALVATAGAALLLYRPPTPSND
jgi:hypothetical protein